MKAKVNHKSHLAPLINYYTSLEKGLQYQDYIVEKVLKLGVPLPIYTSKKYQIEKGESPFGIEIKFDSQLEKRKSLYIEIAEKRKDKIEYIPSGIFRKDNSILYLIGDYQKAFIFSKRILKDLSFNKKYKRITTETSKGFLLDQYAINYYHEAKIDFIVDKYIINQRR